MCWVFLVLALFPERELKAVTFFISPALIILLCLAQLDSSPFLEISLLHQDFP